MILDRGLADIKMDLSTFPLRRQTTTKDFFGITRAYQCDKSPLATSHSEAFPAAFALWNAGRPVFATSFTRNPSTWSATHIGRSRCTRPWSKALKPGSKFRPSAFSNCSKPPATCPTLPTTHRVTTGSPACWCGHGFIRARSPSSMIETTIWVFSVKPTRLNQSGSVMFLPCTLQRISSSTGMT